VKSALSILDERTGKLTRVQIPAAVSEKIERAARRLRISRTDVVIALLKERLDLSANVTARRKSTKSSKRDSSEDQDTITAAMNKVCDAVDTRSDEAVSAAARRILERSEW
jgi:hypothetical protein